MFKIDLQTLYQEYLDYLDDVTTNNKEFLTFDDFVKNNVNFEEELKLLKK